MCQTNLPINSIAAAVEWCFWQGAITNAPYFLNQSILFKTYPGVSPELHVVHVWSNVTDLSKNIPETSKNQHSNSAQEVRDASRSTQSLMDHLSLQSLRVQVGRAVHSIASVAPRGPRQSLTSSPILEKVPR